MSEARDSTQEKCAENPPDDGEGKTHNEIRAADLVRSTRQKFAGTSQTNKWVECYYG